MCLCFLGKVKSHDISVNVSQELISSFTLFQGPLETPLHNTMAIPLQLRIRTMTKMAITVLSDIKEGGGIIAVITQT